MVPSKCSFLLHSGCLNSIGMSYLSSLWFSDKNVEMSKEGKEAYFGNYLMRKLGLVLSITFFTLQFHSEVSWLNTDKENEALTFVTCAFFFFSPWGFRTSYWSWVPGPFRVSFLIKGFYNCQCNEQFCHWGSSCTSAKPGLWNLYYCSFRGGEGQ